MGTTPPPPRRGVLSVLPPRVRKPALVAVVLLTVVVGVLASFTLEPMRAAIWQRQSQSCGAIEAQDSPGGQLVTDSATVLKAEDCFLHGYAHCQAVSLDYSHGYIDYFETDTFIVEPAFGALAGCALAIVLHGEMDGVNHIPFTRRCAGVAREADYSLRIRDCGGRDDYVISAPPDIPPTRSPNIPQTSVTLGGSLFAFGNAFGVDLCCNRFIWDYQGPYGPMQSSVYTRDSNQYNGTGYGGKESSLRRVVGIVTSGSQGNFADWTLGEAQAICGRFLPPDAQLHLTTNVRGNDQAGIEEYYTSVSLANTLLPIDFKDWVGRPATPGTFYVVYRYHQLSGPNAPTIGECRVGTDEDWVQGLP